MKPDCSSKPGFHQCWPFRFPQERELPISIYVTPADMHDTQGARRLLVAWKYILPCLKKIWADAAYRGKELADWFQVEVAGSWK